MSPLKRNQRLCGLIALCLFAACPPAAGDEPPSPETLGTVSGFTDWVTSVAFSPDGTLLAAGSYDETRLIDRSTQKVRETLKTRNGYVRGVAFSADGSRLAVGDYQSLSLWDVQAAKRVKRYPGHKGYVTAVLFAGERLVSACEDGVIRFWNTDSGESTASIEIGLPVNDIALSPDGKRLAVAAGDVTRPNKPGPVMLWDLDTMEKIADLIGHERATLTVAFSPDGTRLASAGEDEKANLHDLVTGKAIGFYAGHSRSVNDVLFLAEGEMLASVSGGNAGGLCELRFWKPDGTEVSAIEPHKQRIVALAVASDGQTLALASQDKTVSFWNAGPLLGKSDPKRRPPVEAPRHGPQHKLPGLVPKQLMHFEHHRFRKMLQNENRGWRGYLGDKDLICREEAQETQKEKACPPVGNRRSLVPSFATLVPFRGKPLARISGIRGSEPQKLVVPGPPFLAETPATPNSFRILAEYRPPSSLIMTRDHVRSTAID